MATHTIAIERWHPTRLNQLLNCHWATAGRRKKADREMIGTYAAKARVPEAGGKRRLALTVRLKPRQRGGDPDAYWKSLCDCLKHLRLIRDDNRQWLELVPVQYERGTADDWGCVIQLEDVD